MKNEEKLQSCVGPESCHHVHLLRHPSKLFLLRSEMRGNRTHNKVSKHWKHFRLQDITEVTLHAGYKFSGFKHQHQFRPDRLHRLLHNACGVIWTSGSQSL